MVPNETSVAKIIKIIKKIRKNTNDFFKELKQSIYVEKEEKLIHPTYVDIFHKKENDYLLIIDDFAYKLKDNQVILVLNNFNVDIIEKGNKILEKNKEVISKTLFNLRSNPYKYVVASTNDKSYMSFEDNVYGIYVKGDCKQIYIEANLAETTIIKYRFFDEEVIFEINGEEKSLTNLLIQSGDIDGVKFMCDNLNEFFKECKINNNRLPLIIKTYLQTNNRDKKI